MQRPSDFGAPINNWVDLVRAVAGEYAFVVTNREADTILWEYTGFPGFWTGDPVVCCTDQLHDFFARLPERGFYDALAEEARRDETTTTPAT